MFEIGFWELSLIGVIALLVIGPERLPETVRTISLWVGRFRRSMTSLKQELEREIGADEIRQQLHNEAIMQELEEAKAAWRMEYQMIDSVTDPSASIIRLQEYSRVSNQ